MYGITPANLSLVNVKAPTAADYGDVYFSPNNGELESDYVFLQGNNLRERFANAQNFAVAELGFGTGLNFHLVGKLWNEVAPQAATLTYISIEKHPIIATELAQIHTQLGIAQATQAWRKSYPLPIYGTYLLELKRVRLILMFMEASEATSQINSSSIDAWFLDGFAPARNPQMWSDDILQNVERTMKCGATFATFTAASLVRKQLQQNGLIVKKRKGYGCKREMLIGNKPEIR